MKEDLNFLYRKNLLEYLKKEVWEANEKVKELITVQKKITELSSSLEIKNNLFTSVEIGNLLRDIEELF